MNQTTRCISGKIPYATVQEAWKMIEARCGREARHTHKRKALIGQAYQCPECRQWHVTRNQPRPKPSVPAPNFRGGCPA